MLKLVNVQGGTRLGRKIRLFGVTLASALLVSACGSASSTASSSTTKAGTPAVAASTATKLSFNANGTPNLKGLTIPIGNGAGGTYVGDTNVYDLVQYLKKWGANATQTNASSNAGELAVASGTLDATTGPPPAIVDGGLTIFGPNQARLDDVLIAKNSITSLAGLKGQKVGLGPVASPDEVLFLSVLQKAKLSPSQVTTLVIGTNTAIVRALIAGQIDAGFVPSEDVAKAGKGFHVLAVGGTILPSYADSFMGARASWLTSHPAIAEAIDLAWFASAKLFNTNEAAWVKAAATYTSNVNTTAQYQAYWKDLQSIKGWPITTDSFLSSKVIAFNMGIAKKSNALKGPGLRPIAQLYNLSAWHSAWAQFSAHESAY